MTGSAPLDQRFDKSVFAAVITTTAVGMFGWLMRWVEAWRSEGSSFSTGGGPLLPDELALIRYNLVPELALVFGAASLGVFVLGLPLHALLVRRGRTKRRDYLLASVVPATPIALLATLVMSLVFCGWGCSLPFLLQLVWSTPLAAYLAALAGAAVFWAVRRPDRQAA